MLWIPKKRFIRRVTFTALKVFTLLFLVIFIVIPLIFKYSYKFQRSSVFLNFIHVPSDADYANPYKYGLEGSRNLYLTTDEGVRLGVWHVLPENAQANGTKEENFEAALGDGKDVFLYVHGNAGTRLSSHRVELYKVLRRHSHVVAFDYRSYGDSSNEELSEMAVVRDCIFMYKWVANRTKGHLFVWGHSLGSSIATHSLALLQSEGIVPTGLVLESPFNNMRDEISEFPPAKFFRHLPWFTSTIVEPLLANGFIFQTDDYICHVDAPVTILHATDDHVVPYRLGRKLLESALKCRKNTQGQIDFHTFEGEFKYDHKFIYRAPEIHDIISDFVSSAITETKEKKR